jgi:sugar/nucleoside kinase (ribokinase family)
VLLIAGNLVYDWIAGPVESLRWDATQWPAHFSAGLGGNGATTAYAAAYLGAAVRVVTARGKDAHGEICARRLESAGVDCHYAAPVEGDTALTMGVFRADGARALIHRPGVSAHAFEDVESLRPFAAGDTCWLHIANPYGVNALRRRAADYLREACDDGWSTSLDTGWDRKGEWMSVVGPCLPYLEWLFTNEPEAKALTGAPTVDEAVAALRAAGARNIVVKLGVQGCLLLEGGAARPFAAYPTETVDSTGAGDCFCGGFLAAMLRDMEPEEAARIANVCGARSVSAAGATSGMLMWRETTRLAGLWTAG